MKFAALAIMALLALSPAWARRSHSGGSHSGSHSSSSHSGASRATASHSSSHSSRSKCVSCVRANSGRIHRSSTARRDFEREHPCPSTGKTSGACPGYVIDHKQPLKRGGADDPSNMQWQTKAEAKAKDRVE